jgi:hypothetical protein
MQPTDPNFGKSAQIPIQRSDVVPPVDEGVTIGEIDAPGQGEQAAPRSRTARMKGYLQPRIRDFRDYAQQHRVATTLAGFGLGFILGRMLRRS